MSLHNAQDDGGCSPKDACNLVEATATAISSSSAVGGSTSVRSPLAVETATARRADEPSVGADCAVTPSESVYNPPPKRCKLDTGGGLSGPSPPSRVRCLGSSAGREWHGAEGSLAGRGPADVCTNVTFNGKLVPFATLQEAARNRRILYLFSGKSRPLDAQELGDYMGCTVDCLDIERDESHDIADQLVWDSVLDSLRSGFYHGVLMSPPCSTFSCSRSRVGGPPPLRGEAAPAIYGLPGLKPSQKELVRIGTLLALRSAEAAELCNGLGIPWILETPKLRLKQPSVLKLPEWRSLLERAGTAVYTTDQCQYADRPRRHPSLTFTKATALASNGL